MIIGEKRLLDSGRINWEREKYMADTRFHPHNTDGDMRGEERDSRILYLEEDDEVSYKDSEPLKLYLTLAHLLIENEDFVQPEMAISLCHVSQGKP